MNNLLLKLGNSINYSFKTDLFYLKAAIIIIVNNKKLFKMRKTVENYLIQETLG